jgi:hypothetical protein
MRHAVVMVAGLFIIADVHSAGAAGVRVVHRIPGYTCMMLNETPQQAIDTRVQFPVRAEPTPGSPAVGNAMPVVAVKQPLQTVNGFYEALFPNRRTVWIAANAVVPYHSLGDPTTKCAPAVMSNGLVGFDYYH